MSFVASRLFPSIHRLPVLAGVAVALVASDVQSTRAEDAAKLKVAAVYDIAYSGVAVATAHYALDLAGGRYQATISYKTTGVMGLIGQIRGRAAGEGAIAQGRVQPASYTLDGKDPKRTRTVRIDHSANGLSYQSQPAPKVGGGRVPLTADAIKGAFDPMSALVIAAKPGADSASVCGRTLPIFDGWARYDVTFSPKGERALAVSGYSGPSIVCGARLRNIAGHKPQDDTSKYWDANRNMEASLIPAGASGLYVPAGLSIKTQYGQIEVTLRSISIDAGKAADASIVR